MSLKHFPVYTCVHACVLKHEVVMCDEGKYKSYYNKIRCSYGQIQSHYNIEKKFGKVLYSVLSKNMDCGARLLRFKSQSCLRTSSVIFSKVFSFLYLSLLICQMWVIKIPI